MSSCERCGNYISPSNMGPHLRGARCAVGAWYLKMEREGYKRVPGSYGPFLRKLGYQTILGPARYERGAVGRKARVYDGHWAPVILVTIIEHRTKGFLTFCGPVKLPLKAVKQQLRIVIRNLNFPRLEN